MGIGDVWEFIVDKVSEGIEEFLDLFRGLFSNLREFSVPGLIAGAVIAAIAFFARGLIITPFTSKMPVGQGIFTEIICYVAVFVVGYLMMKRAFEN